MPARLAQPQRLRASQLPIGAPIGSAVTQCAAGIRPSQVPVASSGGWAAAGPPSGRHPLVSSPEAAAGRVAGGLGAAAFGMSDYVLGGSARPAVQRMCTECEEEENKPVQAKSAPTRSAASADAPREASPVLDVVGDGGGQPLDPQVRADMEGRLGADFSDVRIHTGAKAAQSAAAVSAQAYTVGNEIVAGSFAPSSADGRHTLAHELTHVLQQRKGPAPGTDTGAGVTVSDPSDSFEQEAEAVATRVLSGPQPVAGKGAPLDAQKGRPSAQQTRQAASIQSVVPRLTIERQCDPNVDDCEADLDAGTSSQTITDAGTSSDAASEQPITDAGAIAGAPNPPPPTPPGPVPGADPDLPTPDQIAVLKNVYGSQLNTDLVRINKNSIAAFGGVERTIGNTINIPGQTIDDYTLIHEAAHCWQNQRGDHYIASSLSSQLSAWIKSGTRNAAYDYSDDAYKQVPFSNWNSEEQAQWIADHRTLPPSVQGLPGYP